MSVKPVFCEKSVAEEKSPEWRPIMPVPVDNNSYLGSSDDDSLSDREPVHSMPEPSTSSRYSNARRKSFSVKDGFQHTYGDKIDPRRKEGHGDSQSRFAPSPNLRKPNSYESRQNNYPKWKNQNMNKSWKQNPREPSHNFLNLGDQLSLMSQKVAEGKAAQILIRRYVVLTRTIEPIVRYLEQDISFHCGGDSLIQWGRDILRGYYRTKTRSMKKEFLCKCLPFNPSSKQDILQTYLLTLRTFTLELSDRIQKDWDREVRFSPCTSGQALEKFNDWESQSISATVRLDEYLQQASLWLTQFSTHFHEQVEGNVENPFKTQSFDFKRIDHLIRDVNTLSDKIPSLLSISRAVSNEMRLRLGKVVEILDISSKLDLDSCTKIHENINDNFGRSLHSTKQAPSLGANEDVEHSISLLDFVKKSRGLSPQFKRELCTDVLEELKKTHSTWTSYKYLNPANIVIKGEANVTLLPHNMCTVYEPLPPWVFRSPCVNRDSPNRPKTNNPWSVDVYSLGQIILWLTSLEQDTFYTGSLQSLRQSCPIIDRALDQDPEKRPSLAQIEESLPLICETLWEGRKRPSNSENHAASSQSKESVASANLKASGTFSMKTKPPNEHWEKPQQESRKEAPIIIVKRGSDIFPESIVRRSYDEQKECSRQRLIAKHKVAESLFHDSDSDSVDLDYLESHIFQDGDVSEDELFSEDELSDLVEELGIQVESKLDIALQNQEKLFV